MINHINNGLRFFEAVTICVFILMGFVIITVSTMMKYDKRKANKTGSNAVDDHKHNPSQKKAQDIH